MCEALLERCDGVEVNAEDLRGQLTPLYYAAAAGCREAAEMLLEHGADPEVQVTEKRKKIVFFTFLLKRH